jgi:hypothetical protein
VLVRKRHEEHGVSLSKEEIDRKFIFIISSKIIYVMKSFIENVMSNLEFRRKLCV